MSSQPPSTSTSTPAQQPAVPVSVSRAIPPTDFDNRFVRDIKLTEVPKFLYQHAGYNGFFRVLNFFDRKLSSSFHGKLRYRYALIPILFFMIPGVFGSLYKNARQRDAYIYAKYGDKFETFDPQEKARIRQEVTTYLNENR
jgi:hypothetical protein